MQILTSCTSIKILVISVDPGYPQGAPLQVNCVGVPLSCRFFIPGEPRNKNKAVGYPKVEELVLRITGARCENNQPVAIEK
jgi:hypothetical protein